MTSVTPESLSSAPPEVVSLGPVAWMKKNLFSDWFNSLLTVVLVGVLGFGLFRLGRWAFTTAQWEVIPNNLGLFMTGTYPSELYARVWSLLALICLLSGLTWGVLGRNLSTLFSRNVLIGIGVICAFIILFPPTRPSATKLLPMVAIVAGMAWLGRFAAKKVPFLGQLLSLAWFLSYALALWIIGGGPLDASILSFVVILGVSLVTGWRLLTELLARANTVVPERVSQILGRIFQILSIAVTLALFGWLFNYLVTPESALWLNILLGVTLVLGGLLFLGFDILVLSPQWHLLGWLFVILGAITYVLLSFLLSLLGISIEPSVSTNDWGGLMLTLVTAVSGIALCFPLGLTFALGRRSALPVVRWLSTLYIEIVRGVPLVAFLFMGQVMIPLFLPEGARPDRVLRAIIALSLFSAAYLAENVRAGLQAVPRGQREAAMSLGLNTPMTLGLIILPQALKIAIPAIVGQFISLFQDTTLLAIVGLAELLGIGRSILANPTYLGRYAEVYLFLGVIYWIFCYAMSLGSRKIEEKLNTER
jgi:His/Glu/Gln/Arg/opine family amino acid ABC transporter permease subunit